MNKARTKKKTARGPIAVAVSFGDKEYKGYAYLEDRHLMSVNFPWNGTKRWSCLISASEVTDWKNVEPVTQNRVGEP